MPPGPRATPRRRVLLAGGAGVVLATVGGCGLRLDLPQPPAPVPTRRRVPDEQVLLDAAGHLAATRDLLRGVPDRDAAGSALSVVTEQYRVVVGRLTNGGVPMSEVTAGAATGTGAATTAGPSGVPLGDGAEALWDSPASAWSALATAGEQTRDLLWSAGSGRRREALGLGLQPAPLTGSTALRTEWGPVLGQLAYGMQVVAAQSRDEQREKALESWRTVERLSAELGVAPATPWALPFPVTDPAAAARLATHMLSAAVDGAVVSARRLGPADLDTASAVSARVQRVAADWGVAATPFPGLGTP